MQTPLICATILAMIHALIMAGGKGSRFWPMSRSVKAKQFLTILGDTTLLEQTVNRIRPLVDQIWVVGNQAQAPFFDELPESAKPDHLLLEPVGRNTAPCIGWAAAKMLAFDPHAIMIVLPSDHTITKPDVFEHLIKRAIHEVSLSPQLMTLGIKPTFPHTGYGYIEVKQLRNGRGQVVRFREKPNYDTAMQFIRKKRFFWNSGMFIWPASLILTHLKTHLPADATRYEQLATASGSRLKSIYQRLQSISIDYAVMEKAVSDTTILVADMGWDDIGSWSALEAHWPSDKLGNACRTHLIPMDSSGNIVSASKLVALIDVHHLVVVETPDAILVANKFSDQRIRELTDKLPPEYQ